MKGLIKGCIVMMKAESKMKGYGNPQCVESICEPLGEVSLFGHNQCYKTYHVERIVSSIQADAIEDMKKKVPLYSEHPVTYSADDIDIFIKQLKG